MKVYTTGHNNGDNDPVYRIVHGKKVIEGQLFLYSKSGHEFFFQSKSAP